MWKIRLSQFGTMYQRHSSTRSSARAAVVSVSRSCAMTIRSISASTAGSQMPGVLKLPCAFAAAQEK